MPRLHTHTPVLVLAGLALTACSTSLVEDAPLDLKTEGRVIGHIQGVVRDETTQVPLKDVTVSWTLRDRTVSTTSDENGVFEAAGLPPGTYDLLFTDPEGKLAGAYAGAKKRVEIPTLAAIGITDQPTDEDFEYTADAIVPLYPVNATLEGTLNAYIDQVRGFPVEGVQVYADAIVQGAMTVLGSGEPDYWLISDRVTATTDADGRFSLTGLPATDLARWSIPSFSADGYQFESSMGVANTYAGATEDIGEVSVWPTASMPLIVSSNVVEVVAFPVTGAPTLRFSKSFDTETFTADLYRVSGDVLVESEASWSGDELTVQPYVALNVETDYVLALDGTTVDGYHYTESIPFRTLDGIHYVESNVEAFDRSDVTDFPVNGNITLTFTENVNVEESEFALYRGGVLVSTSITVTGPTVTIDPTDDLANGTPYTVSYNAYSSIPGDHTLNELDFITVADTFVPGVPTGINGVAIVDGEESDVGDWDTTQYKLSFPRVAGAEWYVVYARDTYDNTTLTRVEAYEDIDYLQIQEVTVNLPSWFDYFEDDTPQTPLCADTEVTFFVTAHNEAGESERSAPVTFRDDTGPTGSVDGNVAISGSEVYYDEDGNQSYSDAEPYENNFCFGFGNNGNYDTFFTDRNGNGRYDTAETFTDWNGNGTRDTGLGEPFTDSISTPNGVYDIGEPFTDWNGNTTRDASVDEPYLDTKLPNGSWDDAEPYIDCNGNSSYDDAEVYTDVNGNGRWDNAEDFFDMNGDGVYSFAELADTSCNDSLWNCILDLRVADEPYTDANVNGVWDAGEAFTDRNRDGVWTASFVMDSSDSAEPVTFRQGFKADEYIASASVVTTTVPVEITSFDFETGLDNDRMGGSVSMLFTAGVTDIDESNAPYSITVELTDLSSNTTREPFILEL
jgi:hypothetical protein